MVAEAIMGGAMVGLLRATACTIAGLAMTAAAADKPPTPFAPKQDVKIEYKLFSTGTGSPDQAIGTMTEYIKAGGDTLRIDSDSGTGMYQVIHPKSQRGFVVFDYARSYWESPVIEAPGAVKPAENEKWIKGRKETIAGQDCTNWSVEIKGTMYPSCFTEDGVPLRSEVPEDRGHTIMQATAVTYATLPDSLFQVPEGYRKTDLPMPHMPSRPSPDRQRRH
jgi:hypothetical protein